MIATVSCLHPENASYCMGRARSWATSSVIYGALSWTGAGKHLFPVPPWGFTPRFSGRTSSFFRGRNTFICRSRGQCRMACVTTSYYNRNAYEEAPGLSPMDYLR